MSTHKIYFNRKFYLDKKTGYWISTNYPRIRAHQWVWICIHKIIPKGYHIHHIDDNKSNNTIENLELIERSRHLRHHMNDPLRKEQSRQIAEKIRPLTKEWHASEEGHKWHSQHAIKTKFGKWEPKEYSCEMCFVKFSTSKRSRVRFCSNNCKSKWRRKQGLDNVKSKCLICRKEIIFNKYQPKSTCSMKCRLKLSN